MLAFAFSLLFCTMMIKRELQEPVGTLERQLSRSYVGLCHEVMVEHKREKEMERVILQSTSEMQLGAVCTVQIAPVVDRYSRLSL